MEHDEFCNCEDCWWSRDCKEICSSCGSVDCEHTLSDESNQE